MKDTNVGTRERKRKKIYILSLSMDIEKKMGTEIIDQAYNLECVFVHRNRR